MILFILGFFTSTIILASMTYISYQHGRRIELEEMDKEVYDSKYEGDKRWRE